MAQLGCAARAASWCPAWRRPPDTRMTWPFRQCGRPVPAWTERSLHSGRQRPGPARAIGPTGKPGRAGRTCGRVRRRCSRARQRLGEGGVLVRKSCAERIRGTAAQQRHLLLHRRRRDQGPGEIERMARPSGEERTCRCRVRPGLRLSTRRGRARGPGAGPVLVPPDCRTGPRGGRRGTGRDGSARQELNQRPRQVFLLALDPAGHRLVRPPSRESAPAHRR